MLRRRKVSPRELLEAALGRIESVNSEVNATVHVCTERAAAAIDSLPTAAQEGQAHCGWLGGLPVGIKDLIDVSGIPTTCGSPALVDNIPLESNALIDRLEARGAIVAGKTNTPEFGAGANTFNEVFGATRNPWNTAMNAGGSSGGSAAALATGQYWLCHGSDLAGSLRTPAGYCGVIGFRPSPGRCGGGPTDTAFSLEAVDGPMARDIRDAALLLDAMSGCDIRHPISIEEPAQSFQDALDSRPGSVRVAFAEDLNGFAPVEAEIRTALRSAMDSVEGDGIVVEERCPLLDGLNETYLTLRGIHYGAVTDRLPAAVQSHFKKTLREIAMFGRNLTSDKIYQAMREKTRLYHVMREFMATCDVLALPVTGIAPGPVEVEFPATVDGVKIEDYVEWLRFSFLATTTGLPALSMPCGFTPNGLPVGLQLIGPPRGEARLLRVALELEERFGVPATPIDPIKPVPTDS